jgi:hypothetical protein
MAETARDGIDSHGACTAVLLSARTSRLLLFMVVVKGGNEAKWRGSFLCGAFVSCHAVNGVVKNNAVNPPHSPRIEVLPAPA